MRHPHEFTLVIEHTELAPAWISTSMHGVVACRTTLITVLRREFKMRSDADLCGWPIYTVWHAPEL